MKSALEGLCPRCLLAAALSAPAATERSGAPGPAPDEVQRALAGFEVLECLGRGGMGSVFKARQPRLNRFVAIKVLPAAAAANPEFPARFQREAEVLARLNHPNIVTIHDFGEAGGLYYFVMEFMEGRTLANLIRERKVTPSTALSIVRQICDALQFAHDHGAVHRDIKPGNILVSREGRVKVADFGLVKMMASGDDDLFLTFANQNVGTPLYMAPEQRDNPLQVDHRADLYSLGVVFYELLTGTLPAGRFAPPSQKTATDARLDNVVLRALEADPNKRYQTANELRSDVEAVAARAGDDERGAVRPASRVTRRLPITLAVTAFAAVVLAAAIWFLIQPQPWQHPAPAGKLLAAGPNAFGEFDALPGDLDDVVAATFDGGHGLVLLKTGKVVAYGQNDYGQCEVPEGLRRVTAIAQGRAHNLALRDDGTVVAWGRNALGEAAVPYGLREVVAIDAANQHSAALTASGEVVLWGNDYGGSLTQARSKERIVAIDCGNDHVVGLTASGRAVAWGNNQFHACDVPPDATNLISVAAGLNFSVGLRRDGGFVFWGSEDRHVANAPSSKKTYVRVKAMGQTVGALAEDGTLATWGEGENLRTQTMRGVLGFSPAWYHCLIIRRGDGDDFSPSPQRINLPAPVTFGLHAHHIMGIRLIRDGRGVATISGNELRIYDLASRRLERTLKYATPLWAFDQSDKRRLIACGADDGSVLIYDDSRPSGEWDSVLRQSLGPVTAVRFSPDSDKFITGHGSGEVAHWSRNELEIHAIVTQAQEHHGEPVTDLVFLSTNRHEFFSSGWDGSEDRGVYRWKLPQYGSERLEQIAPVLGWRWRVQSMACQADGILAYGDWDGMLTLSDTQTGRQIAWLKAHSTDLEKGVRWLDRGDGNSVSSVAFTPDGRHVVTGGADAVVRIWRINAEGVSRLTCVAEIRGFTRQVRALAITPDGTQLIASGYENLLSVFDLGAIRP